ncbi:hypothetical protein HY641_04460 [Candidatus Woesearchaeota archaeon]|nr:hypothetical protein [Candidatus Woesearchaeota archaeon]
MEILTYIIITCISSLGLLAGVIVGRCARDELRDARRFFPVMQAILAGVIFAIVIGSRIEQYSLPFSVIAACIVSFASFRLPYPVAWYALFALLLSVASQTVHLPTIAGLIFLHGLAQGSTEKSWKAVLPIMVAFISVAIAAALV